LFSIHPAGLVRWNSKHFLSEAAGKEYYLLLDDTHHIKHFRSLEYIKHNPKEFQVIEESAQHGWVFCRHAPNFEKYSAGTSTAK
jgi:hypothetical protein